MNFLKTNEYEALVREGLLQIGLTPEQADRLLASRWPMPLTQAITEVAGRGLQIEYKDIVDFVKEYSGKQHLPDGRPIDEDALASIVVTPTVIDHLCEWCILHGRGRPSANGILLEALEKKNVLN